jgi:hypothetical protein
VFASGAGVGAFGHRLFTTQSVPPERKSFNHEAARQKYLDDFRTRLKLSDVQVAKLVVILDDAKARFKQARDKMDPEMKQIQEDQRNRTREMLNPDQRAEYEKMLIERDRKRRDYQPGPPKSGH